MSTTSARVGGFFTASPPSVTSAAVRPPPLHHVAEIEQPVDTPLPLAGVSLDLVNAFGVEVAHRNVAQKITA
jgi:hypothetical protein